MVLVIAVIAGIGGALIRINCQKDDSVYLGPATLIAELTDEQGGFICEFECDGKVINAIYGGDSTGLKVGDQVQIAWFGLYAQIPHVMNKDDYDKDMKS